MKFIPLSSATCTDARASFTSTTRNSAPSDEAPNERIGRFKPVLPSARVFILPFPLLSYLCTSVSICGQPSSIHPHANRQQQIREPLLVRRLDRQDVIGRRDVLVELPLLDRLELDLRSRGLDRLAELG